MYRLVVTDRDHVPQGEIRNFGGFQYLANLSKLATTQFSVRLDNPHATLLSLCDGYVKLYRGSDLKFHGPIVTAEETVVRQEQTVAVTAIDAGWVLGKRLAGKSDTGHRFTSALDRAQIAKTLIDTTNAEEETGIDTSAYVLSAGSATTYKAGPYRPVLDCVSELGAFMDGFDWRIVPSENWQNGAVTGSKIGSFQAAPIIGTTRPNAVFEYGLNTRSNVLSYTKTRARDTQANRVFHLAGDDTVTEDNNVAARVDWGLLEDVISADLSDASLRAKLVGEHVQVRGYPRDLIKMTPHIDPGVTGRLPQPFVDYDLGDTITFRAVIDGVVRFAGTLRVYGIKINLEQETGFERVELILEDES